jgi:hypothetical protein
MSAPNAARALPPGDRDEVPETAPLQAGSDLFTGRDEVPPDQLLLPGLTLIIDECEPALEAAQIALADLKMARKQANVALFKAAARRLASLINHVSRQACAYEPRVSSKTEPTKE